MKTRIMLLLTLSLLLFPGFVKAENNHKDSFVGVHAQGRKDHHSIHISFDNLKNTKHISYVFSYDSDSGPNGVVGDIDIKGNKKIERDFLCGTCSSGVCRYHGHVRNGRLEVTTRDGRGREHTRIYSVQI